MLLTFGIITSVAVLVRILVNPLSNVLQKQLAQRGADPLIIISATYGLLMVACLAAWPKLRFTGLLIEFWQNIWLTGLFAMFGNVFLVRAMQIGDLSVLGPINAYKAVVGMLFGLFLLDEIPGWWGLAGVLLIVTGSYVVLMNKRKNRNLPSQASSVGVFLRPEIKLRLAALVFSAIDGVFLKKAVLLSTPTIAFFYWCAIGFMLTLVWIIFTTRSAWPKQLSILLSQKSAYLALCATVGLTQLASNIVLATMPVGYALALFQLSALVSVWFGYQFFREQDIARKLIGATIMVIGAILVIILG
jgi:drug/metabolite transporter (DMT)-like permease